MKISKGSDFIILLLIIAAAAWMIFSGNAATEEQLFVEIYEKNVLIKRIPLSEVGSVIELEHAAVEIDGGEAFFRHSDCPDKVCLHSGKISKNGQMLACVPNEIVVQITSAAKNANKLSANITGYFDTVSRLVTVDQSEDEFRETYAVLSSELNRLHQLYSIYDESSETNMFALNLLPAGSEIKISADLYDMLNFSAEAYRFTGGSVSIYMGDIVRLWQDALKTQTPPNEEELSAASLSNNYNMFTFDSDSGQGVTAKRNAAGSLNVGAIAKGYALDAAAAKLESEFPGRSSLIALGGNIRAVGAAEGWTVGVQNPRSPDVLLSFELPRSKAVATSGDYERYFEYVGVRYHHIIDPGTLMPARNSVSSSEIDLLSKSGSARISHITAKSGKECTVASVTVVAESGALADALTTALFIMPLQDGLKLASEMKAEVLYILDDLRIISSPNFPEYRLLTDIQ